MGPTRATLWPLGNLIRDQVDLDIGERKPIVLIISRSKVHFELGRPGAEAVEEADEAELLIPLDGQVIWPRPENGAADGVFVSPRYDAPRAGVRAGRAGSQSASGTDSQI